MQIRIVYDSNYGNTKQLAESIAEHMRIKHSVTIFPVNRGGESEFESDLVIIGSPTHGGRPTPAIQDYIRRLAKQAVNRTRYACFDTRFYTGSVGIFLKLLMRLIGYAAPKMARAIDAKGGKVVDIKGFIVEGKEGPLRRGETGRAADWAGSLMLAVR